MSPGSRRHTRLAVVALAVLTAATWQVPTFLSAERYRRRLQAGLEGVLQRPVTFSTISLRLLPRPGFTVDNAEVREDPAFGVEPFARADRIECDLRWRSLWRRRVEFARLRLERPSFNIVRNAQGEWNVEDLLLRSGVASVANSPGSSADFRSAFDVEADEARLNFKVGADKKPFAVVDLHARLNFDPALGLVRYNLSGNPIRTDLSLPPPGVLELTGEWRPGADFGGSLSAMLQTRGGLLYNWIPLITGHNPEIYGVIDANVRLSGSLRVLQAEGQARLTQLHRWQVLPPSDPMPFAAHFRGEFDRIRHRALVESADVTFGESHIHLTGAVEKIPASPELDVVVALERARLEDLQAVSRRLWGSPDSLAISGRMDGLLSIQGPWTARRFGGFLGARDVRVNTPSGTFPVSEVALRIDGKGAHLAPVRLTVAPRVELLAEGTVYPAVATEVGGREPSLPRFELRLSAKSIPLRDLLRFGRALGVGAVQGLDAEGVGSATFAVSGSLWPLARPMLAGRAELHAARLLVPGLTEPLNLPRARIQVDGDRIVADPVTAVIGTSIFSGRLEHQGERKNPWRFDIKANTLSVEQGAQWFDVLGHRPSLPLLDRIPGLSSFSARRSIASNLLGALNARGRFETPAVSYRSLTLEDFRANVEVSGKVLHVAGASFRMGGGRGHGRVQVDLTSAPARVMGEVTLAGARLQTLAMRLPPALKKARGLISGAAQFEMRGLTRDEMSASLGARATVHLRNVSLGDFDPLQALSHQAHWGTLEPARGEVVLPSTSLTLQVRNRRVLLPSCQLTLEGARMTLTGGYDFNGAVDLDVRADLGRVTRHWVSTAPESPSSSRVEDFHLAGPINQPVISSGVQVSQASR